MLMLGAILISPSAVQAGEEVDLALVLAVDVSESMDVEEQELQRQGFVEAFRSSVVHEAIRDGMLGRIAVVYLEWAGLHSRNVVVPWTIIEGPEGAAAFADRLSRSPITRARWTSISGAIDISLDLLASSPVEAMRQVIDISGDGGNNQGRLVTEAHDTAVAKGVTINGLPIMLKRPRSPWDTEHLDLYYQDCVIGGPGAFMIPIRERNQFADAIRTKLVREIAGVTTEPLFQKVKNRAPVNCSLSRNWDYWRN
jgi:hypothetical protein